MTWWAARVQGSSDPTGSEDDRPPRTIEALDVVARHAVAADGPWFEVGRAQWARLADGGSPGLDRATVEHLRGLDDPTDESDVEQVYLPLSRLIELHRTNRGRLWGAQNRFLGLSPDTTPRTPLIVGVAGSVAVGKSTTARLLRELLARGENRPRVVLVTTDGFLLPNAELEARGLLQRKGFPESYDLRALLRFVMDVKSGRPDVSTPVYSHTLYDIVPGEREQIHRPDILILEGLNVLQPASAGRSERASVAISDFIDFSVYVDADEHDIERWYMERQLAYLHAAAEDDDNFFRAWRNLSDEDFLALARRVWARTNGPNLRDNIAPTRPRAMVILRKGPDHRVATVRIRKI